MQVQSDYRQEAEIKNMSNKTNKPKLTSHQLVAKMRDEKGITFRYDSLDEAELFLIDRNNYLRLACYRNSYQKHSSGKNAGKYIDLDFAYLKELAVLDMHYRFIVKEMCSDIEHFISVHLLKLVENDASTDGYDIVKEFLDTHQNVIKNIARSANSPHTGDLIQKYFTVSITRDQSTGAIVRRIIQYDDCPVWVLLECLTFGDLISFYQYYCNKKRLVPITTSEVFNLTRSLRNGVSHENCMFCKLPANTTVPQREITTVVKNLGLFSTSQRQKKLSSRTVLEFTGMLYLYSITVQGKVREHRIQQLKTFFHGRMIEKKAFFENNALITSTYEFCDKIIDGFFPS